jgi:hypothetical protein
MKTGFVYIWYDRKHKRYYIGSHWGYEDDGYICSSNWMRDVYRRRPQDFKRRIIKRNISNKKDLLVEEERYLQLTKPHKRKDRYYNKSFRTHYVWPLEDSHHSEETKRKIGQANKGKVRTEEFKNRLSEYTKKQFEDSWQHEIRKQKSSLLIHTEDSKRKIVENRKYKNHSEETKRKIRESNRLTNKDSIFINDGLINKRIKKSEPIPVGFSKGRIRVT